MSKFADDTKLCQRARNPDDIMEQQEDINKLADWTNKWQMSFNVDKCSVMHIGHNNMQSNYNMSNQQLANNRSTVGSWNHHHQRPQVAKPNREKLQNGQQITGDHFPQFQVQKQRTDPPIIQIPHLPRSLTCSAILVTTF